MLKQRVVTGLIMVGAFLSAIVFLPVPALAAVFALVVALGAWEWSRMAGWESPFARICYVSVVVAAMAALYHFYHLAQAPPREQIQPILGTACLWWAFALLWVKSYPASAVLWRNIAMRSLMGLLILVPAWVATVFLLSYPRGGALVVILVLIVVAADVGAYFAGKAFGKHKLAVHVSPAKTWEGFWGGVAVCTVLGLLFWYFLPGAAAHISMPALLTVVLATALVSVVGDLTVSMVKRESGVKDSGSLLPGHGGVLDRLDSLCGAAPVFALSLILAGW